MNMDTEDPIQQLLKSTGWSCDDLLEKLQKYKCQKEPNNEETAKPINKDCVDPKKDIDDSTGKINNCDIPEVQNLKPSEKDDKTTEVRAETTDNVLSNCHIVEEFSDTDEEEVEVNTTNSNIINEIIDEISTGETEGSRDRNDNLDYQTEVNRNDETTEVTEVRVIQVNTDEEDDDSFTDDGCQNKQNSDETLNSNKFQYLETYPRNISSEINQPLIKELNCREATKVDEEESVDFSEETNKNQPLIHEKEINKDQVEREEYDKSVATIDESSSSNSSEIEFITEKSTDSIDLSIESGIKNNIDVSRLQSKLSKMCKKIKLIMNRRTDPPDLDTDKSIEICEQEPGEESISENVEDTQNNLKLQLNCVNTHKETATGLKIDQSIETDSKSGTAIDPKIDLNIDTDNKSNVEEKSAPENLEDIEDNSKSQTHCSNEHKEMELTTDKEIISPHIIIERNKEAHDAEEQSTSENLEDIRNNLKLQLNSLRTRKKGHFLQDLRNNVKNVVNYNKKVVNNCDKDNSRTPCVANVNKSNETVNKELENKATTSKNDNIEGDNLDDQLYTQTNEFGLVILNVQGGIDIDEIEDKSSKELPEDNLNENSSATNNSVLETGTDFNDSNSFCQSNVETEDREIEQSNGVFDEIRKIIRKQKMNTFEKNKKSVAVSDGTVDKRNIDNFGFFSGSSELRNAEAKINDHAKSADISAENSSSSFTADDTNHTVHKNSPFVSNTLDEFLTGDSKLNISYNVPKCGAEEGLSESYHDESPLLLKKIVKVNKEQSPKPKKIKIIKAKTLAQKRKMLEKQRLTQMKNVKLTLEQPDGNIVKSERPRQGNNFSFVMVNGKKIWVKSELPAGCIAKINTIKAAMSKEVKEHTKINRRQRKLSLLTELGRKIKEQVKYRPGPMCKKANLQVSGQDDWVTVMKILPKIFLEITPKIGKPISPNIISRLPQCDGELTESHIEFALSVLKTKTETDVDQRTFKFPLPYHNNQEKIFVRKPKISSKISPVATVKPCNEEKSVDSVVANVINDLITYVEIKEISSTLIKEEERIRDTVADDKFTKMPVIADNVSSIFKKPHKKRSKVELELSRLSCKVVNVEVEENLTREICNKPYCQLGCVCNSLKCDRILTYHCGKLQCMLNCTCPKERALVYDKVTLPAGTDILSTDAVSRIEDEAKKDLAKVEREFTQTVIHTSDKTIVVGLGGRHKSKRATKIPKKYSDYVDSFEGIKEEEKEKDIDKNDFLKKCVVSLENLNLSGIIPFCLTHDLYNCHCNGRSSYESNHNLANTSMSSETILIEDDEEILKKKQTHNPIKYSKSKLKHANDISDTKKSSISDTKKSIITPTNAHAESRNEIDSGAVTEKKQTFNLKKWFKIKLPTQAHEETLDGVGIEKAIEIKPTDLKKNSNSKNARLKPVEGRENKRTANPKKAGKNKPVEEDADAQKGEEIQVIENETNTLKKPSKKKKITLKKSNDLKENHDELGSDNSPAEKISSSGRPVRNIKRAKLREDFSYSYLPEDCARVRGISNNVLKNYKDINKNKAYFQKNDFINNIRESDLLKSKINYLQDARQMLEVDLLKKQLIDEFNRQQQAFSLLVSEQIKHKRKQTLEVRNDENSGKMSFNQAIQRRKKLALIAPKNTRVEPVFDGEIIIDSRNMELLEKMGPRTVSDGYARLLPWKALTESYRNGTIKIWSMVDTPSRLLINKSDRIPPKNYINITQVTQTTEVITWILRNKLPTSYHEDHVSFILKQTKDHYEICGLCTKNFSEDMFTNETTDNSSSQSETKVDQPDDDLTPFPHKDLNGISQLLYIKRKKFKLQELIEENMAAVGETSIEKNRLYMWAALPEILRVSKWRIIFLNSDFTYLYFTKLKYSIKYTDLVNTGNMAKAGNFTVMLRNPLIQQAYSHPRFGIYFDSHYQDRIFIGPYFKEFDGSDIETLRYINKSLVCNESFYKMIGKTDYKCGHWLIERPYGRIERQPEQTIDLTHDSYQTVAKRKHDFDTDESVKRPRIEELKRKERVVIMHNKEQIKVIDGTPRKPEDFNRYIITNIPHFGYLGAYKHNNSSEIDISWPFENKLLRFPTVNLAIDFLQERFSSLLQPIPETFKINVIVLTQIDLVNSHPVNARILSGHYICGDFGLYNVKSITNKVCVDAVGMTREELLRIFAKRAQTFVKIKIEELADLLNIEKSELGRYDIVNILEMAQKEIKTLNETEKSNLAKKTELALQKRDLALKAFCLTSVLPEKEQRWEQLKIRKILAKTSPNKDKTEPIVIPDSDEEESLSNDSSKSSTSCEGPPEISVKGNLEFDSTRPKSILLSARDINKVRSQDGPMVSILNKNIPTKVTETTSSFPPRKQLKLKSVLKPIPKPSTLTALSRVKPPSSVPTESNANPIENDAQKPSKCVTPQYLTGVKIVKTSTGKFVLVSDKNDAKPFKLPEAMKGTKIIIKNSKILSVKKIDNDGNSCEQASSAPDSVIKKINVISTQVCSPINKNVIECRSILDTTDSTSDNSTQPCLENNTAAKGVIECRSILDTTDDNSTQPCLENNTAAKNAIECTRILDTTDSTDDNSTQPCLENNTAAKNAIECTSILDSSDSTVDNSTRPCLENNTAAKSVIECKSTLDTTDSTDDNSTQSCLENNTSAKNAMECTSILDTTDSASDNSTQPCLENNTAAKGVTERRSTLNTTDDNSTQPCLENNTAANNAMECTSILDTADSTDDNSTQPCLENNTGAKNVIEGRSILDTTDSTDDDTTRPCLENNTSAKNVVEGRSILDTTDSTNDDSTRPCLENNTSAKNVEGRSILDTTDSTDDDSTRPCLENNTAAKNAMECTSILDTADFTDGNSTRSCLENNTAAKNVFEGRSILDRTDSTDDDSTRPCLENNTGAKNVVEGRSTLDTTDSADDNSTQPSLENNTAAKNVMECTSILDTADSADDNSTQPCLENNTAAKNAMECTSILDTADSTDDNSTQPCLENNTAAKNVMECTSILDTADSTDDNITQPCLNNNAATESSEILNKSENSVKEISAEVNDSRLSVSSEKECKDNESHTEVSDTNR